MGMTEFEAEQAKYIVFKLEDWNAWAETTDELRNWMAQAALPDAVVIRMKDTYASSALHAYTNAILTVLDVMGDDMDPVVYQQQLDIADYFHQRAVESSEIKGKRLPD